METIKAYTDLEQSKKLAKILPSESADMFYSYGMDIDTKEWDYDTVPTIIDASNQIDIGDVPCWSLEALMEIIEIDKCEICFGCYEDKYCVNVHFQTLGSFCQDHELYDSKIDALIALIEKLKHRYLL